MEGVIRRGTSDWTMEVVGCEVWEVNWLEEYSEGLAVQEFSDRTKAFEFKRWLQRNGYHVTVRRVTREQSRL